MKSGDNFGYEFIPVGLVTFPVSMRGGPCQCLCRKEGSFVQPLRGGNLKRDEFQWPGCCLNGQAISILACPPPLQASLTPLLLWSTANFGASFLHWLREIFVLDQRTRARGKKRRFTAKRGKVLDVPISLKLTRHQAPLFQMLNLAERNLPISRALLIF